MTVGAAAAVVLVVLSVILAVWKVPRMALLLVAAGLSWAMPHLISLLWPQLSVFANLFIIVGVGLCGYAVIEASRSTPTEQI